MQLTIVVQSIVYWKLKRVKSRFFCDRETVLTRNEYKSESWLTFIGYNKKFNTIYSFKKFLNERMPKNYKTFTYFNSCPHLVRSKTFADARKVQRPFFLCFQQKCAYHKTFPLGIIYLSRLNRTGQSRAPCKSVSPWTGYNRIDFHFKRCKVGSDDDRQIHRKNALLFYFGFCTKFITKFGQMLRF